MSIGSHYPHPQHVIHELERENREVRLERDLVWRRVAELHRIIDELRGWPPHDPPNYC